MASLRRLQELPTVTTVLGTSFILMKDSRNGSPEDFQILADNFLAGKLDKADVNTIGILPIVNQAARMVDDGAGGPAVPAVSGKFLTDIEQTLPTGGSGTEGLLQLSDSVSSSSGVGGGIAATPLAVKTVNDAKTGRTGDESPTGLWRFNSTGAMKVPVGTTAQSPANEAGLIRFDSEAGSFLGNNGIEWAAIGGAGGITWSTQTSNFAAENNNGYMFDGANVTTITLNATPDDGETVQFADINDSWDSSPVTVSGSGNNIEGDPSLILNIAGGGVTIVYSSTTSQWEIVSVTTGISGPRNIAEQSFVSGLSQYNLGFTPASEESILVFVGNVPQSTSAYTLTGNLLDFGEATAGTVVVRYLGMPISIGTPSDGTVTNAKMAANSVDSSNIIDGSIQVGDLELGIQHDRLPSAWVNFNGTGTVSIRDSYNVASITDNGIGNYIINFTTPLDIADYVISGSARETATSGFQVFILANVTPTVSQCTVLCGTPAVGTTVDCEAMHVQIFGGKT